MVLNLPYFGCSRHDAKVLGAYEMELPQVEGLQDGVYSYLKRRHYAILSIKV